MAFHCKILNMPGADPGFQDRGGALKKMTPSGGRHEHFWGISCEKLRFYAKKTYFSNFKGGAPVRPPWIRPWNTPHHGWDSNSQR